MSGVGHHYFTSHARSSTRGRMACRELLAWVVYYVCVGAHVCMPLSPFLGAATAICIAWPEQLSSTAGQSAQARPKRCMCTLVHVHDVYIRIEYTDGDPNYGRGDATQRRARGRYLPSSLWAAQWLAIGIIADCDGCVG